MLVTVSLAWGQEPGAPPDLPSDLSHLSLEELAGLEIDSVYGASLFVQKVTEAPSSVTIITADDFQKYGYRTLADALRSVRGFYVTHDRNYSYLGVRGFSRPGDYNARVLLLVDGHRLNDNVFGSALIGTEFPLDIEIIERVEIIRGPSSSLYGTSAFFGVINVITKKGEQLKGVDVSGVVGSFSTRSGRLSYGRTFNDSLSVLFSASSYDSDGQRRLFFKEFDDPGTNNGIAEHADADESTQLLAKVTYDHFTLQGLYGSRDKTIPTASFGTLFNDARSGTVETQGFVDLRYERAFGGGWDVGSRLHYDHYGYDGDYVFDQTAGNTRSVVINKDFARGEWWGAELKLTRRFARRHTLTVGSQYRDNFRQDQFNYDEETLFRNLDDRRSSKNWAVYAQDEVALHNRLRFNVGVRHDHYDTFGGTTNPRAGLIYNPAKKTTVKLLYGQAFRAPNAYELFWRQSDLAKANPALKPETNATSELVLEQYFGKYIRVATTGFYYTVDDLITQQTDPADELLVYNNVEAITARGLELELEGKWANGLATRLSYTYQNSRNDQTNLGLTNSPAHVTQFNLAAPLFAPGLFAGLELQHMSERRTIAGDTVGPVFVPNVTFLSQKLPKGLELSATLYNLFDNEYADPGSEEHQQDAIIQNGRTVRVKATFRFPR